MAAGGRQVDGAISAFSALEKITASSRVLRTQKEGTFTVLFDSGIRQGSDVIKAIAMGAQGILGNVLLRVRRDLSINERLQLDVHSCMGLR